MDQCTPNEDGSNKNRRRPLRPPPVGHLTQKVAKRPPPKSTMGIRQLSADAAIPSGNRNSKPSLPNNKEVEKNGYSIGYAKPPKHTQFKKGQSGNPKGRPKGKTLFRTEVQGLGREMVTIRSDGKRTKVPFTRALLRATMQRALEGDKTATKVLLELFAKYLDDPNEGNADVAISIEDQALLDDYLKGLIAEHDCLSSENDQHC